MRRAGVRLPVRSENFVEKVPFPPFSHFIQSHVYPLCRRTHTSKSIATTRIHLLVICIKTKINKWREKARESVFFLFFLSLTLVKRETPFFFLIFNNNVFIVSSLSGFFFFSRSDGAA